MSSNWRVVSERTYLIKCEKQLPEWSNPLHAANAKAHAALGIGFLAIRRIASGLKVTEQLVYMPRQLEAAFA
jgi:hypothetical protein